MMSAIGPILRWVHILAGAAWLGAVVMVVFVIVPSLGKLEEPKRGSVAAIILPRVFRLASVLSVTVVTAGMALYLERFDWKFQLEPLMTGRWGWSILIGGLMALLLTLFHFFAEERLAPHVKAGRDGPIDSQVMTILRIAPRVGLTILVTVVILMAYATRGI